MHMGFGEGLRTQGAFGERRFDMLPSVRFEAEGLLQSGDLTQKRGGCLSQTQSGTWEIRGTFGRLMCSYTVV